jgi:hypothetical protein
LRHSVGATQFAKSLAKAHSYVPISCLIPIGRAKGNRSDLMVTRLTAVHIRRVYCLRNNGCARSTIGFYNLRATSRNQGVRGRRVEHSSPSDSRLCFLSYVEPQGDDNTCLPAAA